MRDHFVAGVDCSTQATKVVVRDMTSGELRREGRASHPDGTEVNPLAWWDAFAKASAGILDDVDALAVAGQQHGMVCLDEDGEVVRPALLWNDLRSAPAADALVAEFGGPAAWASAVGLVPVASFTVTKLRWLADHEPTLADRVAQVVLPHDWLTWQLLGKVSEPVTDRGDASGTGYWSPAAGEYRFDVLDLAFGRRVKVPQVRGPREPAGTTPDGAIVGPGTGDNMAAALGTGAGPGDVVVSIGTSGTAFAVHGLPVADATGIVSGFADATGAFLPLVCTINAARVLEAAASLLGIDLAMLDQLALAAPPGAGGLVLLPYLEGERTPNRPSATGMLSGLRRGNATPQNMARCAVEGMLCGLAEALDALRGIGVDVRRVLLVGGGSRSRAVQAIAPALFEAPVVVLPPGEYVADGAARQAAWVLAGGEEPPPWHVGAGSVHEADPTPQVRVAYAERRDQLTTD
jgi:xylulokinase